MDPLVALAVAFSFDKKKRKKEKHGAKSGFSRGKGLATLSY